MNLVDGLRKEGRMLGERYIEADWLVGVRRVMEVKEGDVGEVGRGRVRKRRKNRREWILRRGISSII